MLGDEDVPEGLGLQQGVEHGDEDGDLLLVLLDSFLSRLMGTMKLWVTFRNRVRMVYR